MKKYKVLMQIKKIDKEKNICISIKKYTQSIGPDFKNLKEAVVLRDRLLDIIDNNGKMNL